MAVSNVFPATQPTEGKVALRLLIYSLCVSTEHSADISYRDIGDRAPSYHLYIIPTYLCIHR